MAIALFDIPVRRLDGAADSLAAYRGSVALVVNVASACGLTPQYESLERAYETYRERGFVVLGFPCNQFGAQEPGTSDEIATFCSATYDVQFPLFEKVDVNGPARHPIYTTLVAEQPKAAESDDTFRKKLEGYGVKRTHPDDVSWNFEKFLIARDGRVVGRFAPAVTVDEPLLREAIERELDASAATR